MTNLLCCVLNPWDHRTSFSASFRLGPKGQSVISLTVFSSSFADLFSYFSFFSEGSDDGGVE